MLEHDALKLIQDTAVTAAGNRVQTVNGVAVGFEEFFRAPKPSLQDPIRVHTLSAVAEYCGAVSKVDGEYGTLPSAVLVASPEQVEVMSDIDEYGRRALLLRAEPQHRMLEPFTVMEARTYTQQDAILRLLVATEETPDRDALIRLIGNLIDEETVTSIDDGVTQEVSVRGRTAPVDSVNVKLFWTLRPYFGFNDTPTPEVRYNVRIKRGSGFSIQFTPIVEPYWVEGQINHIVDVLRSNEAFPDTLPIIS